MRKIFQALLLISVWQLTQLTAHAINSKEQNFTQNLATAVLSASTTFSITDAGFLSIVSFHFSAAPASAETINIYRDSRAGVNFDTLLARYVTVAGTTTDVTFVFANVIPIAETDQIRVTCTNDSAGDPTVSVSVVLDPAVRNGSGVSIYDNGALKISQYQHDYHWHYGDVIPAANQEFGAFYADLTELTAPASPAAGTRRLYVDDGTGELSVRTSAGATVSLENSTSVDGHEIQEEGVGLAQEPVLNFTGGGVTCTAGTGETICDIPTVSETDPTLTDDGAVTVGSGAANPTVVTFDSDAGTDGTMSYNGTTDTHTVGPNLTVAPGILGATDVATVVTTRLGQKMGLDNSANYGGAAFTTWAASNADHSPFFEFNRSRSDTLGTHTVVTNGDTLGYVVFRGSDGTAFQNSSFIQGSVDGVPGASDMPGRLRFFTASDGSATPVERVRIDSAGHIRTAGTAPTLSACGVTPTILGNDIAGKVTTGSGVITSCTLTFDTAWTSAPACTVNDETAIQLIRGVSTTTTLIITSATAITSQVISYICIGRI